MGQTSQMTSNTRKSYRQRVKHAHRYWQGKEDIKHQRKAKQQEYKRAKSKIIKKLD